MKSFLFMLLGLVAGCGAIILCYAFVSIPIVPCAAVWLAGFLCSKAIRGISRAVVVIAKIIVAIVALLGIALFGYGVYQSIAFFPEYLNVFGIILNIITVIGFVVTWIPVSKSLQISLFG